MEAPIYVRVEKYKELVEVLHAVNERLEKVHATIERINELKAQEDAQLRAWAEHFSDVKTRVHRINEAFYE
jgi:hypothetical protein